MFEAPRGNGFVFEHREVAAQSLGRSLDAQECVHHKDENKRNNDPDNLMVFRTLADHAAFHKGMTLIDHADGTFSSERAIRVGGNLMVGCRCGGMMVPSASECWGCRTTRQRADGPDLEELKILVWEMPTVHVANLLGISDVAVGNWCNRYGIDKPPRGYWSKQRARK